MRKTSTERSFLCAAFGTVFVVSIMAVGCAAKTNPALDSARAAQMQARQDSDITTYAPAALQESEAALRQAEQVWEDDGDSQEVNHLAYVTERKVDIARTAAQEKKAEAQSKRLSEERERVRLEVRMREAERARQTAAEATERTRRLEAELAELRAKQTERGLVLTLDDVLFEFNKADLKPGAMRNLYPLVTFLQGEPARDLLIEGHTDSIGSDAYNLDLSQHRAEAVRSFLVLNGIDPVRITIRGYGEAYPVTSNDTDAGRQQNRRVEVVILHEGELASRWMR